MCRRAAVSIPARVASPEGGVFPGGTASMADREKAQGEPDRGWRVRFSRPDLPAHWGTKRRLRPAATNLTCRERLTAGGRWIRTFGSGASGEAGAFLPVKDRPR